MHNFPHEAQGNSIHSFAIRPGQEGRRHRRMQNLQKHSLGSNDSKSCRNALMPEASVGIISTSGSIDSSLCFVRISSIMCQHWAKIPNSLVHLAKCRFAQLLHLGSKIVASPVRPGSATRENMFTLVSVLKQANTLRTLIEKQTARQGRFARFLSYHPFRNVIHSSEPLSPMMPWTMEN